MIDKLLKYFLRKQIKILKRTSTKKYSLIAQKLKLINDSKNLIKDLEKEITYCKVDISDIEDSILMIEKLV